MLSKEGTIPVQTPCGDRRPYACTRDVQRMYDGCTRDAQGNNTLAPPNHIQSTTLARPGHHAQAEASRLATQATRVTTLLSVQSEASLAKLRRWYEQSARIPRSEEHTSELQSLRHLV